MIEANLGIPDRRPVEIFNFDAYDAIVNRQHADQPKIRSLLSEVTNGIPMSWNSVFPHNKPYLIFQDSQIQPTFAAKIRYFASPEIYREEFEEHRNNSSERKYTQARNSLLNEIYLAPSVQTIVQSEETQGIAREYGINTVSFIEPLLGLIERSSGRKIMFYPWQNGFRYESIDRLDDRLWEYDPNNPLPHLDETDFSDRFEEVFTRHGIKPNDLSAEQFIAEVEDDGAMHLNLIDIEGYVKLKK